MIEGYGRKLKCLVRARIHDMRCADAAAKLLQLGSRSTSMQLDLGAGGPGRPGTVGIDMHPNADLVWDLTHGIPCGDNSVNAIYSDHFLEHLPLADVVKLLEECHRVLMPGGSLRFTVPHIDPYIEAWRQGNFDFVADKIADVPDGQEALYATPFDRISWLLLREGEHKALFDRESILHKVRLAGFKQVRADSYNPDTDTNPRFSSIYVEGTK